MWNLELPVTVGSLALCLATKCVGSFARYIVSVSPLTETVLLIVVQQVMLK